jgi:hypothetical protein
MAGGRPLAAWRGVGAAPFGFKGAGFDFSFSMLAVSSSALSLFDGVHSDQTFLPFHVMRPTGGWQALRDSARLGCGTHVLYLQWVVPEWYTISVLQDQRKSRNNFSAPPAKP